MAKSNNRTITELIGPDRKVALGPDSGNIITLIGEHAFDSSDKKVLPLQYFSTLDSLPTTNLVLGEQAFVTATSRLYVSNGSGWYNVAFINSTPTLTVTPSGTVALSTDGSTTVIRLLGADSDNSDDNLTYSVESGGDFFKMATLVQDSAKQFTITPRSSDSFNTLASDGSSTLTFKVTDGIAVASGVNTFTLSFGPDWTASQSQHRIPNPDGTAYDYFGHRVDTSSDGGRFVVMSSTGGEVEVYQGSAASWTQEYKATEGSLGTGSQPGDVAMSADGSIIAIGRPYSAQSGNERGDVVVRTRSGSTWSNASGSPTLAASDKGDYDKLGRGIDISGDGNYIIAGAPGETSNTGAAYIFYQGSTHTWAQQAKITSTGGATSEQFGVDVDIDADGTRAIIGAWKEDTSSNTEDYGAAYVFKRTGTSWAQEARIVSSDIALDDEFGNSVAINTTDGTVAIVGAYNKATAAGAAYIFKRDGTSWSQDAKIVADDAAAYDYYGWRVAITADGSHVFVTAQLENSNQGKIYVYKNTSGSTWAQQATIVQSSRQSGYFGDGLAVNNSGDIVIAGAHTETATGSNAGAVYITYFA